MRSRPSFVAVADVAHPNLVRLHELFAEAGAWFFTMELLDGAPFDEWVRPLAADLGIAPLDEARLRAALPQLLAGGCCHPRRRQASPRPEAKQRAGNARGSRGGARFRSRGFGGARQCWPRRHPYRDQRHSGLHGT